MKVKIKGLVFVGFAAAILSANAMATDENTVTSKAYVDNKFQTISHKVAQGTAETPVLLDDQRQDIDDTHYPTAAAVKAALDEVSSGASDAYQLKSDADFQIGMDNGAWKTLVDGTNTTVGTTAQGNVKIDVTEMTGADGTDAGTAGTVPAPTATDNTKFLRGDADWVTALENVQVNGADLTVDANNKVNVTIASGTSDGSIKVNNVDVAVKNAEVTTHKASAIITDGTSNDNSASTTAYASTKAVYDYVQSQTGGTVIPQKATSMCTAALPCALVYETSGAHWRVMAVSEGQATAAGTLADFCDATHTCSLGTCTSNVCTE